MKPHEHLKQQTDRITAYFDELGKRFPKPTPNAKHLARAKRLADLIDRIGDVVDNADPDEVSDAMWEEWGGLLADRVPEDVRSHIVQEAADAADYDHDRDEAWRNR